MQQHVKILAILNIAYGAMTLLAGLVLMAVFGGLAGLAQLSSAHDVSAELENLGPIMGILAIAIPILLLIFSAPSIIAGIGLLKYQGWARILTIVLSGLHLLSFPFGTALGIYGLWALLKPETEAMFRARPHGFPSPAM